VGDKILEIKNLHIHYMADGYTVKAVNGVNLNLERGESLGLVGETGAGKTTTALGILGLIPKPPGKIVEGEIFYNNENLLRKSDAQMRKIRGREISMIFQDPMTALNPVLTVGAQIAEVIRLHEKISAGNALIRACEMMKLVGIDDARHNEYPHQFSGGMKQRIIIAIALACNPSLLLADEPTTALDVTIQEQVLDLIEKLRRERGTSLILISHDLGVVAEVCDKVAIIYAGEVVEYGTAEQIFNRRAHPYTRGLFDSIPDFSLKVRRLKPIEGMMSDPTQLPEGCFFAERCPYASELCQKAVAVFEPEPGHRVKCLLAGKEDILQ
jgi:peptide/nickel transport system ATP-binding protein